MFRAGTSSVPFRKFFVYLFLRKFRVFSAQFMQKRSLAKAPHLHQKLESSNRTFHMSILPQKTAMISEKRNPTADHYALY